METYGGVLVVLLVVRLAFFLFGAERERRQQRSMDLASGIGEELRGLLYRGEWARFEARERQVRAEIRSLAEGDAALLAAKLSLSLAEYGLFRSRPAAVREAVAAALEQTGRLPPTERLEFTLQGLALAGLALDPAAPDAELLRRGEEALARAGEATWRRTRVLLTQAALQLARVQRARGDRAAAVRAAERALELAGQPDLAGVRAVASSGAAEMASWLLEAGDEPEAARWFDRSEQLVSSDETPPGRRQRAFTLLARVLRMPGDRLLDAPARRARLERACEAARDLEPDADRQLFARASGELAQLHGAAGEHARAVARFGEAVARLAGLQDPVSTRMRLEARIACGLARRTAQDLGAAGDFQLAMDEAAAHADPGLRELALPAAFSLASMLAASGMHDHAGEVLDRARLVADAGPEPGRSLARARVEYERSALDRQMGRSGSARERLLAVLAAARGEAPAERMLHRVALASLGRLALVTGDAGEAAARLAEALAMAWGDDPESDAERAQLEWHLATASVQLGRPAEAREIYERAFERGRASGLREGRYAAGQAALQLAEHSGSPAERRRWYEAAAALAKLCGSSEGDALARHVADRLRARAAGGE